MFLMKQGNTYNVPISEFYVESDSELNQIPANAPVGSIANVNENNNFHQSMKTVAGSWNKIVGGGGSGASIPTPTIEDAGKILGVDETGAYALLTIVNGNEVEY